MTLAHVIHMYYTEPMTTAETITAAVAERTRLVVIAESKTGRAATIAWKAVEKADQAVRFAASEHERFVRSQMVGAPEAEIQKAARAA